MKITNINARIDRAGKHNDRNFNLDNASHIDQDRVKYNKYYIYNGDTNSTFTEIEKEFYSVHFSDHIQNQNERNELARHRERNKTIESYVTDQRTRPEDKILQIGNIKEHASGEELWECALEYMRRFDEIYGDHCKILDMALHMDEATPHVHVRRVWIAEDENGHEYVSQKNALYQMGIMDPDPTKPNGKYNNAKMTFTDTDKELFTSICIERGLDIENSVPKKSVHLGTVAYKKKMMEEELEELERRKFTLNEEIKNDKKNSEELSETIDNMISYIESSQFFSSWYANEMEELKNKSNSEKFERLCRIFETEAENVKRSSTLEAAMIRSEGEKEIRKLQSFLEEKGLLGEYKKQNMQKKEIQKDFF